MKDIILLGGPNGAGKTTAAKVLLPEFLELYSFLNADEMARNISPSDSEAASFAAGQLMMERMRVLVHDGKSFAIETTCAGKSYASLLQRCKQAGWRITLLYFWLPTPEMAIARVALRVTEGGHNIPSDVVLRRYYTGLSNMCNLYLPLADEAEIYDNSDKQQVLIAEKREGRSLIVHEPERWARIQEVAS